MKKIGKWIGIIIGSFVVLVGIIFAILTFIEPGDENKAAIITENKSTSPQLLDEKQLEIDNLIGEIKKQKNELFFSKLIVDSLGEALRFSNSLINGYKDTIEKLNEDLLAKKKVEVRIKELAKTYETMKVEEMRPILAKVDDETVIAIYENMSSRSRKTIMNALSGERAAMITIRLAGVNKG